MRIWHWAVALSLGSAGAALVIAVLSRMWRSCGVGLNAVANGGVLLFDYAPAVALAIATPTLILLGVVDRRPAATAPRPATAAPVRAVATAALLLLLTLLVCWITLAIGHNPGGAYPSERCVDNVPDWWPSWIPL